MGVLETNYRVITKEKYVSKRKCRFLPKYIYELMDFELFKSCYRAA